MVQVQLVFFAALNASVIIIMTRSVANTCILISLFPLCILQDNLFDFAEPVMNPSEVSIAIT